MVVITLPDPIHIFIIVSAILVLLAAAAIIIARMIYKMAFFAVPNPNDDVFTIPDNDQYRDNRDFMVSIIKELNDIPYESVTITSHDGLKLFGRYYHVTDDSPVFIEFHGYRSMGIRDFCGGDRVVRSLKHNTLIVDQRAHGRSEGNTITFGIKERRDCLSWIEYVLNRFGDGTKVFLIGVSMGAATVLMASELDLPKNVVGIMADCPYSSPWEIISKVGKGMHIPTPLAYPLVLLSARLFGGFDLNETSAVEAVKNTNVPILLIHGEDDRFVPCDMSRRIAEACASDITFITFPEAGHALSYIIDEKRYTDEAIKFINQCLQK